MSNKKQTTVEWLIEKLQNRQNAIFNGFPHLSLYEIFKQAKELKKQQIKDDREDMTKIKLYTEEQVRMLDINCGNATLDEVIECLTPLELPSDEEIKSKSSNEYQEQKQSYENSVEMFPVDFGNYLEAGFIEGAKWMRDKIQGGRNEE